MPYKLGSLFDGSGGFPLAGSLCGIEPVWAAEIEPYPIAVTRSRFPQMKHLGSVTDINGAEIEPVDIITFGSPCQDLSVAGKQAGLKHESNGDDETTRSGLFMEAVRIIREMREATDGAYPTFALWENVPGAFSSNRGEDFRTVLGELIKLVEPSAVMPDVPKAGWAYADSFVGDGWNLAWRVFDAQYWGVPQRRRRIHLVLDFRGERAREVLFEREGLRGYFAPCGTAWKRPTADAERSVGTDDRARSNAVGINGNIAGTLDAHYYKGCGERQGIECEVIIMPVTYDARGNGDGGTVNTITGDHNNRITDYTSVVVEESPVYCLQGNMIGRADHNGPQGDGVNENVGFTLNTLDRHAVAYAADNPIAIDRAFFNQGVNAKYDPQLYEDGTTSTLVARGPSAVCVRYIVRRLTPTECARLQGFPDWWGKIDPKGSFTPDESRFWSNVRNTHAAINGRAVKDYTEAQMLMWYNKLHTDSAEYKMWGNGIALPPALYCMQGIAEALQIN